MTAEESKAILFLAEQWRARSADTQDAFLDLGCTADGMKITLALHEAAMLRLCAEKLEVRVKSVMEQSVKSPFPTDAGLPSVILKDATHLFGP